MPTTSGVINVQTLTGLDMVPILSFSQNNSENVQTTLYLSPRIKLLTSAIYHGKLETTSLLLISLPPFPGAHLLIIPKSICVINPRAFLLLLTVPPLLLSLHYAIIHRKFMLILCPHTTQSHLLCCNTAQLVKHTPFAFL
jgi:hypothetical protein